MKKTLSITITLFLITLSLAPGLSGCSPRVTPTPEPPASTPTAEVTPTPTVVPEKIVLFDPAAQAGEAVSGLITEFAAANSIGFETWSALADLTGVKIMVLYGMIDNLTEIAASAPQTQFLVVSQSVSPSANVSTLSTNPVHLAFMAGFLTAMTSTEWRAGALMGDDANLGLADAFFNGGKYLCGRCTPKYGPMLEYPQVYSPTGTNDAVSWTSIAQALWTDTSANSVFVDTAADFPEVLDVFSAELVITNNPASPNLSRYAAVLGPDTTAGVAAALPTLLAGSGGQIFTAPLAVTVINNPDAVSSAKQALFNEVAQKLAKDQINPLSVP